MSWGTRIAVLYLVFVAGILLMVVMSARQQIDLVRPDYYAAELAHQAQIDATANAQALSAAVELTRAENGLRITLPAEMKRQAVAGSVMLYRPSDASLDRTFDLQIDTAGTQLLTGDFSSGRYHVLVNWKVGTTAYYSERNFDF